MEQDDFKYVFGPVVSRRLGRSLGIDVVPFKTCTYDCVYCQLGRTTRHTIERGDFVPMEAVVAELARKLDSGINGEKFYLAEADYVTIAGSGEPTLYSRLGELIHAVKNLTAIPVAVLTNGSLLWDKDVQESLLEADLVVPSLDVATPDSYMAVNRPCFGVPFDKMVDGLVSFRERFHGQYWLEILLLRGIAANETEIEGLAELLARIRPGRVQLHTVARPSPGGEAQPVPREDLEQIAARLGPNVEVVMPATEANPSDRADESDNSGHSEVTESDILNLVRRHPCTLGDIASGLRTDTAAIQRHLGALIARHAVHEDLRNGETFYLAAG